MPLTIETIISLCKRGGLIFQSSVVYGGLAATYDYGPLGAMLKRNVNVAWHAMVNGRDDLKLLDAAIMMHPRVWEALGHIENFHDPVVDCKSCKMRALEARSRQQ